MADRANRQGGVVRRALCRVARMAGASAVALLALGPAATDAGAQAAAADGSAAQRLRIVGGLAGVNQYTRVEEPFWSSELQRLSGGRYSAEIVPFDRAGIRGQDMLSLMQSGVVPFGTLLISQAAGKAPELGAADLAGLNPDMASLQRTVAAFRPYLERQLLERYGVQALALYVYPAQVLFCRTPIDGLRSLAGKRVRTSSASQSDFVEALGAKSTVVPFAEVLNNLRAGNIDCAITGTMSGYTIGLHAETSHLHTMAINWGLAVFGAHAATWAALPADLKALLQRALPQLERRVWADSQRDTGDGVACNSAAAACAQTSAIALRRAMVAVPAGAADEKLRADLFARVVLPRWLQRCGAACASVWNQTLAASSGVAAKQP